MKKTKLIFGTLIAALSLLHAAPTVKVSLDRESCLYKCNEKATFTITFTDDEAEPLDPEATFTFTNDGVKQIKEGKIDLKSQKSMTLVETMDFPAFLRLDIKGKYTNKDGKKQDLKFACTAGFDPEKIQPSTPYPADFMDYWKGELKKADAEVPLDVQMTKLDKFSNEKYTSYKVSFAAPGGRVYGFLSIPKKEGKMPAIVSVPGAGPGVGSPVPNSQFVTLHINVHPYDPMTEGKTVRELYKELNKPGVYMFHGGNDREKTFFHRSIIGIARAVEWLANRPEVDASRIGYYGSSQGGAFGLILTGLTGRIAATVCNVPAMCDHFGADKNRNPGWPGYRNKFKTKDANGNTVFNKDLDAWVPYYDAVNFAKHIKCPIRIIVGFIDVTCSPSSVYSAFNSIPSQDKQIINETDMPHAQRPSFNKANAWMRETITKGLQK